jgi:L,D-peptidoglycan transpeptidase YkuD (ErfK/YbiS/YcfS/YnhG family)
MIAHLFPKISQKHRGILKIGYLTLPCAIGRSGVVTQKREGDGATPRGTLRPVAIYFRADQFRHSAFALPAKAITRQLGWCDDPHSSRYNRPIPLPSPLSHEKLWRDDELYDIVIETDWNRRPAISGRGSAIFIHLARKGFTPTEGCLAFDRKGMKLFLSRLRMDLRIRIH